MRVDGSPTSATAPEVPGDPEALLAAASALLAAGARLGGIGAQVEGAQAALGSSWSGTASAAALTASAAAAQPLTEADVAFIDAGTTLQHFAHDLQAAKKTAHTAGEHAAEAAARATKADSALVELAADPHADARVVDRANRHLTEANEAHAAAVAQAVAAYDRAEQAARDAGARFAQLAAAAPQPPPPPPPPAPPHQDHRNWFERRLDDVGGALDDAKNGVVDAAKGAAHLASDAWDEMGQIGPRWLPGTPAFERDVLEGAAGAVAGAGQSAWMLFKTSDIYGAFDPAGQQATQQQLGQGLDYAVHHPWEAGKQILGLEHLEQGEPGKFVGEVGITALAALGTDGASVGGKAVEGAGKLSKLPRAAVRFDADAADSALRTEPPRLPPSVTYRGDTRPPEVIFREGFHPRGTSTDLYAYARHNTPSVYVGTSVSPEVGTQFAGPGGFRYVISKPGGIDVNAALGAASPFPSEAEIVFANGIEPHFVVGAHPVLPDLSLGEFVPNPGYRGAAPVIGP